MALKWHARMINLEAIGKKASDQLNEVSARKLHQRKFLSVEKNVIDAENTRICFTSLGL